MQTDEVRQQLRDLATDSVVVRDELLTQDLQTRERHIAGVSSRPLTDLPSFPRYVLGACGLAAVIAGRHRIMDLAGRSQAPPTSVHEAVAVGSVRDFLGAGVRTSTALAVLLVIYVSAMQFGLFGFRTSTFTFAFATTMLLSPKRPAALVHATAVAFVLSFGLHTLFTEVFVIDLP